MITCGIGEERLLKVEVRYSCVSRYIARGQIEVCVYGKGGLQLSQNLGQC